MEELNKKIKSGSNTLEEYKRYMDYREARVSDTIKASQAMQIVSVNGKKLDTLAERIEAMKDFPLRAWSKANRYITEDLSFGIDPEVTFPCTVTGKMITRRFPFRIVDFIPTVESIDHAGDDVSVC